MGSREDILAKIRLGIAKLPAFDFKDLDTESSLYVDSKTDLETQFTEALTALGGQVISCTQETLSFEIEKLIEEKNWDLKIFDSNLAALCNSTTASDMTLEETSEIQACLTACEVLVARTGSVLVSETSSKGRIPHIIPENHLVVASTKQLVATLDKAFEQMKTKYGDNLPASITYISGASRTADIEKTLILGAHGPKNIFVFLTN